MDLRSNREFEFSTPLDLIWHLVRTEYISKYAGSILGLTWSLITPILFSLVVWFVFEMGFKVAPMGGVPFIVYFLTGYVVFVSFSDAITSAVNSIVAKPYLVKNTVFPLHYLVVVSVATTLLQHVILFSLIAVVTHIYDFHLNLSLVVTIYGLFALVVFSFSLGLLFATLNVIFKDVGHFSNVLLNMWFWATPIIWSEDFVPEAYELILVLNPLKHIIDVYRQGFLKPALIDDMSFAGFVAFWLITGVILGLGVYLFRRLKPIFADSI